MFLPEDLNAGAHQDETKRNLHQESFIQTNIQYILIIYNADQIKMKNFNFKNELYVY